MPPPSGPAWPGWWAVSPRITAPCWTRRDALQARIDAWHLANRGPPIDQDAYAAFLRSIGYLAPEPPDFTVSTANVDPEIASIAGPQLVVPVNNARYALNAGNARWGSLYDALYGTDAIGDENGTARGGGYNPVRGAAVVARAREFLDGAVPLAGASHAEVVAYAVRGGRLEATLASGAHTVLTDPGKLAGYPGRPGRPHRRAAAQPRAAHRAADRPQPSDRPRPTRPASPTW